MRERGRASVPAAAAMWPPDQEPDPDPDPAPAHAGRSPPGAAMPGLRALLPARAYLCSLKGRLLLAESVSATRGRGWGPGPLRRRRDSRPRQPLGAEEGGRIWVHSPGVGWR